MSISTNLAAAAGVPPTTPVAPPAREPAPSQDVPAAPAPGSGNGYDGRDAPWARDHAQLQERLRDLAARREAEHLARHGRPLRPGENPPRLVPVPIGTMALTLQLELADPPPVHEPGPQSPAGRPAADAAPSARAPEPVPAPSAAPAPPVPEPAPAATEARPEPAPPAA